MAYFKKKLTELSAADIDAIITAKIPEDGELEFKQTLAAEEGKQDIWFNGFKKVGSYAKEKLACELVAFANTDGGTLILGIEEDGEKRASKPSLLPECRALADQLGSSLAAKIDPKPYTLECVGVEMNGKEGVVVFQIEGSSLAPHCENFGHRAYVRVGDRSEPMGMRQIQDMSIERWRGREDIVSKLASRKVGLVPRGTYRTNPHDASSVKSLLQLTCRATLAPSAPLYSRDVAVSPKFRYPDMPLRCLNPQFQGVRPFSHFYWAPILQGIQHSEEITYARTRLLRCQMSSGLVEDRCIFAEGDDLARNVYFILDCFARSLIMAELTRRLLKRRSLPFLFDLEWNAPADMQLVYSNGIFSENFNLHQPENSMQLMLDDWEGVDSLWNEVQREFFASAGLTMGNAFPYNFAECCDKVFQWAAIV